MKYLAPLVAVLIAVCCNAILADASSIKYIGKWSATGRGTIAVYGDMEIRKDKIHWERHGWIKYRVVKIDKNSVFLELARNLNGGRYVLLSVYDDPFHFHPRSLEISEFKSSDYSDPNTTCGTGSYDPVIK